MSNVGECLNALSQYPAFVGDVNDTLQRVGSTESTTLLENFNAYNGTGNEIWKSVTGRHGDQCLSRTAGTYCSFVVATGSALRIPFCNPKNVHEYSWHRPSMAKKSLINFCIMSSDLILEVLDI